MKLGVDAENPNVTDVVLSELIYGVTWLKGNAQHAGGLSNADVKVSVHAVGLPEPTVTLPLEFPPEMEKLPVPHEDNVGVVEAA